MRLPFAWTLPVAAAAILLITMGGRQTIGLFIAPLDDATGLGIVAISLAIAIGQLVWGLAQPLFGGFADRFGAGRVIAIGGVMLAAGLALTPFVHSEWALIATLGVLSAFGAGAGSLSILIGAVAQRLAPEQRSLAAGFVNAGGSLGQFVFAPLVQMAIIGFGWGNAMLGLAAGRLGPRAPGPRGAEPPPPAPRLAVAPPRPRLDAHGRDVDHRETGCRRSGHRIGAAAGSGGPRSELLVAEPRLFPLRLSRRFSGLPLAWRGPVVRLVAVDCRQFARDHRDRQYCRQPLGRVARRTPPHEASAV